MRLAGIIICARMSLKRELRDIIIIGWSCKPIIYHTWHYTAESRVSSVRARIYYMKLRRKPRTRGTKNVHSSCVTFST